MKRDRNKEKRMRVISTTPIDSHDLSGRRVGGSEIVDLKSWALGSFTIIFQQWPLMPSILLALFVPLCAVIYIETKRKTIIIKFMG